LNSSAASTESGRPGANRRPKFNVMPPGVLEIRRQQTLTEIGAEHDSTIIALMPTECLQNLTGGAGR